MKGEYIPTKRFQHSMVFVNKYMIMLGGRGENEIGSMSIEVYDTEVGEWSYLFGFNKFRHVSFAVDKYVFVHGGCEFDNPCDPVDNILMFDFMDLTNMLRK
jgi:hypothetical protein